MKKHLLTGMCLLAASTAAFAKDYVDTFDTFVFPDEFDNISMEYYESGLRGVFTYEGDESGISYQVCGVMKKGSGFRFAYDAGITNKDNKGLFLKSVEVEGVTYQFSVLTKDTPFEISEDYNVNSYVPVTRSYSEYNSKLGNWNTCLIDGVGKYFYFEGQGLDDEDGFQQIIFTWTDEAPVKKLKKPEIYSYDKDWETGGYKPGSVVNIEKNWGDENVTIKYTVALNDGTPVEYTGEAGTGVASYTLGTTVGDKYTITAWATADGCQDSEKVTETCEIMLPKLMKPEFNEWSFKCIAGNKGKIYNENADYNEETHEITPLGTLYYSINGVEGSTTENEYEFTVTGNVGDAFVVKAWVKAEGYMDSDVYTYSGTIVDNKLSACYFNLSSEAEYQAGVELFVQNDDYRYGQFCVKVGDGEWETYEDGTYEVSVIINEPTTVYAQLKAWTEGDYTFYADSEITEISVKIEKLAESMHVLVPSTFSDKSVNYSSLTGKTADVKGVTYETFCEMGIRGEAADHYFEMGKTNLTYIANTTASEGYYAIKLDIKNWNAAHVYFSNEPFFACEHEMNCENHKDDFAAIVTNEAACMAIANAESGKWINLKAYDAKNGTNFAGSKYFMVTGPETMDDNSWLQLSRVVLDTDQTTGIAGVEAVAAEEGVYNLNGVRVNNGKLLPGVYVKVVDGKATKILVK